MQYFSSYLQKKFTVSATWQARGNADWIPSNRNPKILTTAQSLAGLQKSGCAWSPHVFFPRMHNSGTSGGCLCYIQSFYHILLQHGSLFSSIVIPVLQLSWDCGIIDATWRAHHAILLNYPMIMMFLLSPCDLVTGHPVKQRLKRQRLLIFQSTESNVDLYDL